MAEKNDGGDKTEKPTQKRLQDARKKGDVAKSKDIGSTAVLLAWLVLGALMTGYVLDSLSGLFDEVFRVMDQPFNAAVQQLGWSAAWKFVVITAVLLLPVALVGTLVEFLQIGPVLTFQKMTPTMDHMNPGEGLKRMFNTDNLFEVVKSLIKTVLLVALTLLVLSGQLEQIMMLPAGDPDDSIRAFGATTFRLLAWTLVIFVFVAVLDLAYQKFSFLKKMRMSIRDIRQEMKDMEGDPMVKARRRELAQEWAQGGAVASVRDAAALVVNPTHVAVSLAYDPAEHAVPVVTGKGEGPIAAAMRAMAETEGVPIIRNVPLARALNDQVAIEAVVPEDMFAAVAEIILMARRMRDEAAAGKRLEPVEVDGGDDPDRPPADASSADAGPTFPALPAIGRVSPRAS